MTYEQKVTAVQDKSWHIIREYREENKNPIVLDAALLFQAGWNDLCDEVWLVTSSPVDLVRERLTSRGLTIEEINKRINSQHEYSLLVGQADIHIDNSYSMESLSETVKSIWTMRIQQTKKGI